MIFDLRQFLFKMSFLFPLARAFYSFLSFTGIIQTLDLAVHTKKIIKTSLLWFSLLHWFIYCKYLNCNPSNNLFSPTEFQPQKHLHLALLLRVRIEKCSAFKRRAASPAFFHARARITKISLRFFSLMPSRNPCRRWCARMHISHIDMRATAAASAASAAPFIWKKPWRHRRE